MLKSISLENFKAFGQRTRVSLAPITLIYGQNSSGKSSILQSLNLLKQTCESHDANALLLPRSEGGLADLGSFHELLFDHDQSRSLKIRIDSPLQDLRRLKGVGQPGDLRHSVGLELVYSRKSVKEEISLDSVHLYDDGEDQPLASYEKLDSPRQVQLADFGLFSRYRLRDRRQLRQMKCVSCSSDSSYWEAAYESMQSQKQSLIDCFNQVLETGALDQPRSASEGRYLEERAEIERNGGSRRTISLRSFVSFLTSELSFDDFRNRMAKDQIGQLLAVEGFIPIGSRFEEGHVYRVVAEVLRRSRSSPGRVTDLGNVAVFAGQLIERSLLNLFPLGPFRKPPARWYVFSGTTPQDVGLDGQSLPDLIFRNEEIRNQANEWLNRLDIGYELNARSVGAPGSDLFELRLRDTRRKNRVEVSLTDVGFGISQILPLIVQSVAATNQTITIEQPEVHIHPKLQADLGDLLIESIKKPRQNQFLIETHSEHLALRLQRRIREKQLSPKDVSILYVSRSENGSKVIRLRLDEEGRFIDGFPGGFFPERLRELM